MADLVLKPEWPEKVYSLSKTDPAQGGEPDFEAGAGKANWQAQQIGDRTEWLRAEMLAQKARALRDLAAVNLRQFQICEILSA